MTGFGFKSSDPQPGIPPSDIPGLLNFSFGTAVPTGPVLTAINQSKLGFRPDLLSQYASMFGYITWTPGVPGPTSINDQLRVYVDSYSSGQLIKSTTFRVAPTGVVASAGIAPLPVLKTLFELPFRGDQVIVNMDNISAVNTGSVDYSFSMSYKDVPAPRFTEEYGASTVAAQMFGDDRVVAAGQMIGIAVNTFIPVALRPGRAKFTVRNSSAAAQVWELQAVLDNGQAVVLESQTVPNGGAFSGEYILPAYPCRMRFGSTGAATWSYIGVSETA